MSNNLVILGTTYSNAAGFKATDDQDNVLTFTTGGSAVLGTKSISANGTYSASSDSLDGYSEVTVNVPATGVDIPTFTVTYSSGFTSVQSVTCDKTYAQCLGLVTSNDPIFAAIVVLTDGNMTYTSEARAMLFDNNQPIEYVQIGALEFDFDLVYGTNGTITFRSPSNYVDELSTTENGYYDSSIYKSVTVNVPTGTARTSADLTASGATVTVPAGLYSAQATKTITSGTEGTPTATKGSVSNHSISVTPSVTNTAGYISGGTHTGTAVTVSASELDSGTKSISANGTGIDVVGYAAVDVAVPASSNDFIITLSYNSTTQKYEPDRTYAEIDAAHTAGKDIILELDVQYPNCYSVGGWYNTEEGNEYDYWVDEFIEYQVGNTYRTYIYSEIYSYTSSGLQKIDSSYSYYTDDADAAVAEVKAGKIFYNANGRQVGTATARSSSDLTASGATVTVPAGIYASQATKSVTSGSATPAASISATGATITTGTNTLTLSKSVSNTPQVSAGYVSSGTAGNSSVSLTATVNTRSSSDLTASGDTVTAPAGYYASAATKSVASGTAGTPSATKGTVSNHQVSVTPSVTNTTGYITGGTKTGTAVTVTASELVSGSETKSTNGTYDVTNLASITVNVPTGEDIPVFTVTWDSGWGDVVSVTCNKTFAACYSLVNNEYRSAIGRNEAQQQSTEYIYTGEVITASSSSIKYCMSTYCNPAYDIEFLSNGTINVIQPSSRVLELPLSTDPQPASGYSSMATISRSTSDQYLNISAGVNAVSSFYKISAVPNGTAGTPTATKGTVSNHQVSVTPSVTNTTGYITGGTKTGSAVTVTAAELVSGTLSITSTATQNVTNYASATIDIPFSTITVSSSNPSGGSNGDIWIKTT